VCVAGKQLCHKSLTSDLFHLQLGPVFYLSLFSFFPFEWCCQARARTRAQEVDNSGTELFEYACPCKVRGRWCASVGVGMSCRRIACNSAFSHSLSSLDQPLPTG